MTGTIHKNIYNSTSNAAVDKAFTEAKAEELKNNIANASTKAEAFKLAREGLGAGKTFEYGGQTLSTNTLEESQAIAKAQGDALSAKNLSSNQDCIMPKFRNKQLVSSNKMIQSIS
jgi:hypothetical protein